MKLLAKTDSISSLLLCPKRVSAMSDLPTALQSSKHAKLDSQCGEPMKYLYVRCNGGHYFRSSVGCPFDGWTCDGLEAALWAFETGAASDIEALGSRGVPQTVLARLLVVDFGDPSAAFKALVPERYLHQGRELLAHEVGLELS